MEDVTYQNNAQKFGEIKMTKIREAVTATHKNYRIVIELLDDDEFIPRARVMLSIYDPTKGLIHTHCNGATVKVNMTLAKNIIKDWRIKNV